MKLDSNITVYLEVFNEEERIESCLKSFLWADELIVFDKHSTDKTLEIANKYATQVITVPFTPASENFVDNISKCSTNGWFFFITAASLIHPELVDAIKKLTNSPEFDSDVIAVPYAIYAFGLMNHRSPWSASHKTSIIRKSALKVSSELHKEIGYSSEKIYKIPYLGDGVVLFHCTHADADDFFNRHIRYVNYEAQHLKSLPYKKQLRKAFLDILRSLANVLFKRRSFMLGWNGVALGLGYISYFIMKFIYVWDMNRENGNTVYPELREKIDRLWDERQ